MIFKNIWLFITRKKYIIVALLGILFICGLIIIPTIKTSVRPKGEFTIVIDAGHGGFDVK